MRRSRGGAGRGHARPVGPSGSSVGSGRPRSCECGHRSASSSVPASGVDAALRWGGTRAGAPQRCCIGASGARRASSGSSWWWRSSAIAPGRLGAGPVAAADGEVQILERGDVGVDPGQANAVGAQRSDQVRECVERRHLETGSGGFAAVGEHAGPRRDAVEQPRVLGVEAHDRVGPVARGELVGGAGHESAAALHHHDVVCESLGLREQVGAHHHRASLVGEVADQLQHRVGGLGVEPGSRLVEQQQLGVVQHGPGEREAGLHARRVAAHGLVERLIDREPTGCLDDSARERVADPVELARVGQVLASGEAVVQRRFGRDHTAARADVVALGVGVEVEGPARCRHRGPGPR